MKITFNLEKFIRFLDDLEEVELEHGCRKTFDLTRTRHVIDDEGKIYCIYEGKRDHDPTWEEIWNDLELEGKIHE